METNKKSKRQRSDERPASSIQRENEKKKMKKKKKKRNISVCLFRYFPISVGRSSLDHRSVLIADIIDMIKDRIYRPTMRKIER